MNEIQKFIINVGKIKKIKISNIKVISNFSNLLMIFLKKNLLKHNFFIKILILLFFMKIFMIK